MSVSPQRHRHFLCSHRISPVSYRKHFRNRYATFPSLHLVSLSYPLTHSLSLYPAVVDNNGVVFDLPTDCCAGGGCGGTRDTGVSDLGLESHWSGQQTVRLVERCRKNLAIGHRTGQAVYYTCLSTRAIVA